METIGITELLKSETILQNLKNKLNELRVNVASTKKISNVVQENEKLKLSLDSAHNEINELRLKFLEM